MGNDLRSAFGLPRAFGPRDALPTLRSSYYLWKLAKMQKNQWSEIFSRPNLVPESHFYFFRFEQHILPLGQGYLLHICPNMLIFPKKFRKFAAHFFVCNFMKHLLCVAKPVFSVKSIFQTFGTI